MRKETIQEPVNPNKWAKSDTIPDVEKVVLKKQLHYLDIRYTTKVVIIRKIVVIMIHPVKLVVW